MPSNNMGLTQRSLTDVRPGGTAHNELRIISQLLWRQRTSWNANWSINRFQGTGISGNSKLSRRSECECARLSLCAGPAFALRCQGRAPAIPATLISEYAVIENVWMDLCRAFFASLCRRVRPPPCCLHDTP